EIVLPLGSPVSDVAEFIIPGAIRSGVIFAGSLSKIFDFQLMVNVWHRVCSKRPDLATENPLRIIGDGSEYEFLLNSYSKSENVVVHGHLPHREAIKAMCSSKVGLAPYSPGGHLTMPNKFFEYMAAGLPIVATLDGDAQSLLSRYRLGYTFPDGNVED